MNETNEREELYRRGSRWYHFYYIVLGPFFRLFYPMTVRGRERIPEGAAILCGPHTNLLDPLLVSYAMGWKHYIVHMAKAELMRSAFASFFMRKAGSIFIRRGESDIEAFKQCIRVLKDGKKLMIFPEGTRVRGPEMGECKPGAVRLAQKLQVPIQPVYITRNKKPFHRVQVAFGEPYMVEKGRGTDPDALPAQLRERILALEPR